MQIAFESVVPLRPRVFYEQYIWRQRYLLIALFLLSLVVYGFNAFNFLVAGDDWWRVVTPDEADWRRFVKLGRWMNVIFRDVLFGERLVPSVSLFFCIAILILSGIVCSQLIGASTRFQSFIFSSLLILNPTLAEKLNYKMNLVATGFGIAFSTIALYLAYRVVVAPKVQDSKLRTLTHALLASLFLALAAGVQQTLFIFCLMIFVGSGIFLVTTNMTVSSSGNSIGRLVGSYTAICALGLVQYFLITKSLQAVFHVPEGRHYGLLSSLVSSGADMTRVWHRFGEYIDQFLFSDQHLWTKPAKFAFLGVLVLYVLTLLRWLASRQGSSRSRKTGLLMLTILAVCGLLIIPWSLGLIRVPNPYRYNALMGLLPLYPIVFTQTLSLSRSNPLKACVALLAIVVVAQFAYYQGVASLATYSTNKRDQFVAERIITRIESHSEYKELSKFDQHHVILVGDLTSAEPEGPPFAHNTEKPMDHSIVQCGVLNCQAKRFSTLVKLISYPEPTRNFVNFSGSSRLKAIIGELTASERQYLARTLRYAKPWPAYEAIQFLRNTVWVVLSTPKEKNLKDVFGNSRKQRKRDKKADGHSNKSTKRSIMNEEN